MILPDIIKKAGLEPSLIMLDVGARPTDKFKAPFHKLGRKFKKARILAFDADAEACPRWNDESPGHVLFYPYALGRTGEVRDFFRYEAPEHSSFYRIDPDSPGHFHGPDRMKIIDAVNLETVTLDWFLAHHDIDEVDFLKADVQGAELEVLHGAMTALADCLMLVLEVAFIPVYHEQPLFEDVTLFLRDFGFRFHKFTDPQTRSLKPMTMNGDIHQGSQLVFADAVYLPALSRLAHLSPAEAIKSALLLDAYESFDWACRSLERYDRLTGSDLSTAYARGVAIETGLEITLLSVSNHT